MMLNFFCCKNSRNITKRKHVFLVTDLGLTDFIHIFVDGYEKNLYDEYER